MGTGYRWQLGRRVNDKRQAANTPAMVRATGGLWAAVRFRSDQTVAIGAAADPVPDYAIFFPTARLRYARLMRTGQMLSAPSRYLNCIRGAPDCSGTDDRRAWRPAGFEASGGPTRAKQIVQPQASVLHFSGPPQSAAVPFEAGPPRLTARLSRACFRALISDVVSDSSGETRACNR
jgi:hypothetical protein